tara:strand:- start:644 stop:1162 length:519 start_codon:yes stop_codon:yes gene_type:complete
VDWIMPIAGMLVGWVTNILAIEMLFSPRKPLYLLGKKVPFTPGLIPQNRDKMLDIASDRVSNVMIDTLNDEGAKESYEIFNKILDAHWSTKLFLGDKARKDIFKRLGRTIVSNPDVLNMIKKTVKNQMSKYSIDEMELLVRKISRESLQGIKIIGAVTGLVVGVIAMLIGGI